MTKLKGNKLKSCGKAGFSLVELLAVIGIVVLLTAVGGPAVSALTSSGGANQNVSELSGILEQAREYAVAQNTYVWVAFYTTTSANGYKQISAATIASTDGTDPAVTNNASSWSSYSYGTVPGTGLALVSKITTLKQVYLENAATFTHATFANLPSSPGVDSTNSVATLAAGFFSIKLPNGASPVAFNQAIEFTPSGQARNSSSPISVVDVDVQPQRGVIDDPQNVAVLRVNGLTGETTVYRP